MTKGIKNTGLGGTPYKDNDSMLFEMLGVYRRPNLPPTPDGPGPATPPNPGGNVPGGKSNSGGNAGGGGGGKGPKGDKGPNKGGNVPGGGYGGGGGGGSTPPVILNTTGMNTYYSWARKPNFTTANNTAIVNYDNVQEPSPALTFNNSLGEFTAQQAGWYFVFANGQATEDGGVVCGLWLQKSTGGAFTTIHKADHMIANNQAFIVQMGMSLTTLVYLEAGHKLRLFQSNEQLYNVYFNVTPIWTSALFYSTKAAASGAINTTIGGWDSVTGYEGNYAAASMFDTSTGTFTCPETGHWVFVAGGRPNVANTAGQNSNLRIYVNGVLRSLNYNQYNIMSNYHTHNHAILVYLKAGDQVTLYQASIIKKEVNFGGFKIHDQAVAWAMDALQKPTTSAAGTPYAGFANLFVDTHGGANKTTGTYTIPADKGGNYTVFGSGRPITNNTAQALHLRINAGGYGYHYQRAQDNTTVRTGNPGFSIYLPPSSTIDLWQELNTWTDGQFFGYQILGADSGLTWVEPGPTPSISTSPVVSGSAVGGSTLTTTNGTWDNPVTPYTYQWLRNGTPISGATESTYTTIFEDEGAQITSRVNSGTTAAVSSNSITVTAPAWPYGTDPYWNDVSLMHEFTAGEFWYPVRTSAIKDQKSGTLSWSPFQVTAGGRMRKTNSNQEALGSASNPFPGNGGTPFTIEFWQLNNQGVNVSNSHWVLWTFTSPNESFVATNPDTDVSPNQNTWMKGFNGSGGGWSMFTPVNAAINHTTNWTHYCWVGQSGVRIRFYLNGIHQANLAVGTLGQSTFPPYTSIRGEWKNWRTTKADRYGVLASGANFTPDVTFGKG